MSTIQRSFWNRIEECTQIGKEVPIRFIRFRCPLWLFQCVQGFSLQVSSWWATSPLFRRDEFRTELKLSMWVLRISSTVPPRVEIFQVGFTDQLEGPPFPKPDTNSWSFWPCKFFAWTSLGSALRETTHGFLALRECASWPRPSWECPLWPDAHKAQAQSYTLLRLTVF